MSRILSTEGVSAPLHAGIHPPPHTDQRQTPPRPEADTPPLAAYPPGAVHAGRYGQQAGGKHPTGMHTCMYIILDKDIDKRRHVSLMYGNSHRSGKKEKKINKYLITSKQTIVVSSIINHHSDNVFLSMEGSTDDYFRPFYL